MGFQDQQIYNMKQIQPQQTNYLQVIGDDITLRLSSADHSINSLAFNTTNIIQSEKFRVSTSLNSTSLGHSTTFDSSVAEEFNCWT